MGYYTVMLALWIIDWMGLFVYYGAYVDARFYWVGFGIVGLAHLGLTEVVYDDAKAINKLRGRKVLDATLWSLVTFLLSELTIPWYVLSGRKNALATP